jgi:hypothetical protein
MISKLVKTCPVGCRSDARNREWHLGLSGVKRAYLNGLERAILVARYNRAGLSADMAILDRFAVLLHDCCFLVPQLEAGWISESMSAQAERLLKRLGGRSRRPSR